MDGTFLHSLTKQVLLQVAAARVPVEEIKIFGSKRYAG